MNRSFAMAAPQAGYFDRFFIMSDPANWYNLKMMYKNIKIFINPEIIDYSKEKVLSWEGCISNNEFICLVERPSKVIVKYQTMLGKQTDMICVGLVARIFQHELDHLDGITMESKALETKAINELVNPKDLNEFYQANKHRIIEQ